MCDITRQVRIRADALGGMPVDPDVGALRYETYFMLTSSVRRRTDADRRSSCSFGSGSTRVARDRDSFTHALAILASIVLV